MTERAPELHTVQSLKDSSEESWLVPALLWNSSTAFISTCSPPLLEAGGLDGWTSSPVSSVRGSCKQVGAVVWQAAASKAQGLLLEAHGDVSLGWGISRGQSLSWKVQTLSPCHVQPGH